MSESGAYSWQEINTQGDAWRDAIAQTVARRDALLALMARNQGKRVVFTGCGSTHALSLYAAPMFQRITGRLCRGAPASELWLQTDTLLTAAEAPLAIAVSRSGETSETVQAVRKLRTRGSDAITISCYDDTELAQASSLTIAIPAGQEESFAQTRSFSAMLLAAQTLAALTADDETLLADLQSLPDLADGLIARANPLAKEIGQDETIKRITYLGAGPLYGLACEAMIKMKEMSLSTVEAFHTLDFRHGPMSLVDGEHLVVALISERTQEYELAVLRDVKARGARVMAIANTPDGLGDCADQVFTLDANVQEGARGVLYLPLLQLLAYHRAMGRGLNPDRPRNVVMAIRLDGAEMI